jgi:alkaline phosphatase D
VLDFDPRYKEQRADVLAARARQAFFEYWPLRPDAATIYRRVSRGPLCELFFLDLRSFRGPNTRNLGRERNATTAHLGEPQLAWLKRALRESTSVWKVICTDLPLALYVNDPGFGSEAWANNDPGAPAGRELELADLLGFLRRERIRNVIWLTADVHYAASHRYDPLHASFTDFDPFWEFVSGPLHAGSFGPNTLDRTFGPQQVWASRAPGSASSGPWTDEQYFGTVRIEPGTHVATVTHHDRTGRALWHVDLEPTPRA